MNHPKLTQYQDLLTVENILIKYNWLSGDIQTKINNKKALLKQEIEDVIDNLVAGHDSNIANLQDIDIPITVEPAVKAAIIDANAERERLRDRQEQLKQNKLDVKAQL